MSVKEQFVDALVRDNETFEFACMEANRIVGELINGNVGKKSITIGRTEFRVQVIIEDGKNKLCIGLHILSQKRLRIKL